MRRRTVPIVVTTAVLATGMAYSLLWAPVVRHQSWWLYSADIWGAYRSAHYIAWGALGSVYAAGTGLITFPGILLLFAPLAALTGHLGLTECFPFNVPHPTAWLALDPYQILIGCTVLFASDALAERLGVSARRRVVLCVAQGVVLWPVTVIWGHPEDALATALALYATVLALDDRWTGAGWLMGAAMATQPLVILALPILLARAGRTRVRGLVVRAALPAVVLLAVPLAYAFHATAHALVDQPNYPLIDHVTPWTALAPRLGGKGVGLVVAGGPGRLVAVAGACALGWWVSRHRQRSDVVVWAMAVALGLRCLTESVMDPFYLWPPLAVGLLAAVTRSRWRQVVAVLASLCVTIVAEWLLVPWWSWWGAVTAGLVLLLTVASPARTSRVRGLLPIAVSAVGEGDDVRHPPALAGASR